MEQAVQNVLRSYEERARAEWRAMQSLSESEMQARIDEFLLFVGPDTAKFMHTLVLASKARVLVELGASYGYSTLWLADAARETGGKLHSLELSPKKVEHARNELRRAGLEAYVEFHVGDALQSLKSLTGPLEFVLIDLWKELYVPCFESIHPKLAPGAFVLADNMTFPVETRAHAEAYRAHVRARTDLDTILLPIGSGIELSKKHPA